MLSDKRRRVSLLSRCDSVRFSSSSVYRLSEPIADLLIEVLGHITTLQCLRFLAIEHLMRSSPRILPAFAALSGIYHLEIDTGGELGQFSYAKLLKTMCAPLKTVRVSLPPGSGGKGLQRVGYNRNLDPLWLFSSFSSTLESMFLTGRFTVEGCSTIHVYPCLTHLTLPRHCMPLVRPYINAFPSLRSLHFDNSSVLWATDFMPTHSLSTDVLRGKSSEELRRHNREDQFARGSWFALEDLMAMTLDAYTVGLTCRIPSLHLIAWGGTLEGEVAAICDIYTDARPTLFRLALRPPHIDYIAALFSQRVETFSSLSSLELRLDVTEVPFDFKTYLDDVGTALQQLPIVSLQVEIRCFALFASRPADHPKPLWCDSPSEAGASCYTLDALSGEDMEGRVRYFMRKIRTLRRATVAWGRCLVTLPHRLITVDLDNLPHTVDRPGRVADKYWKDMLPY
ncbi:hypothetical protein LXA43DRAFT_1103630 [Ganoderma leucocontextum]|nr:hypothetical protein LXA43DRAFT_1103630 [Ganoderma leucocontextum]